MALRFAILVLFSIASFSSPAQEAVTGKWITIDDETGDAKSVIELYVKNNTLNGKIINLLSTNDDPDPKCDRCDPTDDRYMKSIKGMIILKDLVRDGEAYSEGTILDPENGKVYKCKIWLEGSELRVRGYWGPFFRTQTWLRSKDDPQHTQKGYHF